MFLALETDALTVTVSSEGVPREPLRVREVEPDDERGRGLLMVDALADDWDHYVTPTGVSVWATFTCLNHGQEPPR